MCENRRVQKPPCGKTPAEEKNGSGKNPEEKPLCGPVVIICGTDVILCGKNVISCGTDVILCGTDVILCGTDVI